FDEIENLVLNDVNARTNALITGQADVISRCDIKTVDRLAKSPGIQIVEIAGAQHYTAPMFTDVAPFNDLNVRLALKYAVDRQALLETVLFGHGVVGNDSPISTAYKYYHEIPQRPYDPDKAMFHLKQAGMSSLKVTLHTAGIAFPGAVDTAVLFKEHAKKAN